MAKKRMKIKSTQTAASADQDVVGLITTLVQKLVTLETKIDTVLGKLSSGAPKLQPAPMPSPAQNRDARPMHKAVCADCGKNCEVPFKPSGDRPVYCKSCFTARKQNNAFKPRHDDKSKVEPLAAPAASKEKKKPSKKKAGKHS
jgi:CxxC-x17-CxxC domain-containing protein